MNVSAGASEIWGRQRDGQSHQCLWLPRVFCKNQRWCEGSLWDGNKGSAAGQETWKEVHLSSVIGFERRRSCLQAQVPKAAPSHIWQRGNYWGEPWNIMEMLNFSSTSYPQQFKKGVWNCFIDFSLVYTFIFGTIMSSSIKKNLQTCRSIKQTAVVGWSEVEWL